MKFDTEQECPLATTAEREIARDIREKLCYTELKSTAEINKDKTFELPDGTIIFDGAECFRCAKVFFLPCSYGKEARGFHDTSFQSKMKCDVYTRKETYANAVLSSGTTKTFELPDRNIISVGDECFHCVDILLLPSFIGKEANGFHETSFHNIMKCDADIRENLYVHVLLPGGTTMFQRIFEHMTKELTVTALASSTMRSRWLLHPSACTWYGPTFELPDENIIIEGAARSTGEEASGFHDTSFHNIMKSNVDICKELYTNVLLPGGTPIFQCERA